MRERLEQQSFLAFLILVTVAFLLLLRPFYAPVFWAFAVALIFFPMQRRLLARWPGRRNLAAMITLLLSIVVVVIPVLVVAASFIREGLAVYDRVQQGEFDPASYLQKLEVAFPSAHYWLQRLGVDFSDLGAQLMSGLKAAGQFLAKRALDVGQNTFQFFVNLGLMLYLTFFLLRDGPALVNLLIRALPLGDDRERMIFSKFAEVTRATVKGNLVIAVIQGALGGLIFWILGMPAAVLWAVVMALLSLIPALGASLVWVPVALYMYAVGDVTEALILVLFGVFVIGLVDNLLRPVLVGRDTKLPDYLVLFSTLGGLTLFGITGFALGPLLAGLFVSFWQIFIQEFNVGAGENGNPAVADGSMEEQPVPEAEVRIPGGNKDDNGDNEG
ncbi:AI-2E family transporter [Alcanivorax sp. KX64203]|nr:AI-2E family transporter [Alcanivorax sp. KX64203]